MAATRRGWVHTTTSQHRQKTKGEHPGGNRYPDFMNFMNLYISIIFYNYLYIYIVCMMYI